MKHFKLTNETKVNAFGVTLFRIELTIDCKWGKVGDKGGFVEKEENLSGDAWVSGNAQVYGDARVSGDAWVSGNAQVYGDARVSGDARVESSNDYCAIQSFGSENRTTTFFKTKTKEIAVKCGCFEGSIVDFEARVKSVHGDNKDGREYMAAIALVKIKFETL